MVTDWKGAAEALRAASMLSGHDMSETHLALVNSRLDAEGLRNRVWMVMPYRCERCGRVEWYEAEVGVEGPPRWREESTYIASPFAAGVCPRDGAVMTHLMHRDLEFGEPVEPGTEFVSTFGGLHAHASCMFRVPRKPVQYVTEGCENNGNVIYAEATHAFLSTPMHAIIRKLAPTSDLRREAEPFA